MNFRHMVRNTLQGLGLIRTVRLLRQTILRWLACLYWMSPSDRHRAMFRGHKASQQRLMIFRNRYADTLGCAFTAGCDAKRVLVVSGASLSRVGVELCLMKALESTGFVLTPMVVPTLGIYLADAANIV